MPVRSFRSRGDPTSKYSGTVVTVSDVVINEEHVDYGNTGVLVGQIRFKPDEWGPVEFSKRTFPDAMPLESELQSYPLIGESVIIQTVNGKRYYSRRINKTNRLQLSNPPFHQDTYRDTNSADQRTHTQQAVGGQLDNSRSDIDPEEQLSNVNYQPKESLHNLKHFDGDIIIQNRYGATLRFGSSQSENALNQKFIQKDNFSGILGPTKPLANDPIIVMRVGEREDAKLTTRRGNGLFAQTVEDVNRDDSSFVLSSNQQINFHFATTDSDVHFRSSKRFTTKSSIAADITGEPDGLIKTPLMGNQSILNSGRLVLNAKTDNIILSSGQDFISLATKDTILDTGEDFIIGAKQIYLMSEESITPQTFSPGGASSEDKQHTGSVAIAEKVMEVFKEVLELLLPEGFAPYQAGAPPVTVTAAGLNGKRDILEKMQKIRSKLVRIQK